VDASLRELEERLGDAVLRVHRGGLVVTRSIAGISKQPGGAHFVLFADGFERVRLSRRQASVFRKYLDDIS